MALNTLEFDIKGGSAADKLTAPVHHGVVGSGDMEVLMTPKSQGGRVTAKIVTPVSGFDQLWERVLNAFVAESQLADVSIEINDNNATPAVVMLRLRQAIAEAASK